MNVRRVSLAVGSLLAIGLLLVIAIPAIVWPSDVKLAFADQVERVTGKEIDIKGPVTLSLVPHPMVRLKDVSFGGAVDDLPPVLSAREVSGSLRLLPLLVGQLEVSSFTLFEPAFYIASDAEGRRNWAIYKRDAFDEISVTNPRIGSVTLVDGTLRFEDLRDRRQFRLDGIEGTVVWPRFLSRVNVDLDASFNERKVAISGTIARPVNLLFGGSAELNASLIAPGVTASIEGDLQAGRDAKLSGAVEFVSENLSDTLSWGGIPVVARFLPTTVAASGNATLTATQLTVKADEFSMDELTGDGALTLDLSGPVPPLRGTLAFNSIVLDPILRQITNMGSNPLSETTQPDQTGEADPVGFLQNLADAVPQDADIDLRISASQIAFANLNAENAAFSLTIKNRRADIGLANADMGGGALSGALTLDVIDPEVSLSGSLSMQAIPVSEAIPRQLGLVAMAGVMDATMDIKTAGLGPSDYVSNLSGTGSVRMTEGSLHIPEGLQIKSQGVPQALVDVATANLKTQDSVSFDRFETRFNLDNASTRIEALRLASGDLLFDGQGSILLDGGEIDMTISASRPALEENEQETVHLIGTIEKPTVEADVQGLVRLLRR